MAIDGGPGSQHLTSPLTLSISQDGKEWVRVWKAEGPAATWEVSVNSLYAGAPVPGKPGRYVRIQLQPKNPESLRLRRVRVYGFTGDDAK